MIAGWMLHAAAVGLLLSGGALALERALRACALPTRWAWVGATVLTLAVPAAGLLPREEPPAPARTAAAPPAGERMSLGDLPLRTPAPPRLDLAALDRPLGLAWGAGSAATLLALLGMGLVLRRRRAGWRAARVDGVPVLLSRDTGPAVVGLFRSRIVLPEWAAASDPELRDLMLAHELEHLRAGDVRLLAAALAALVLAPWNPALWWQLRRLRLAVEVDCDARVLRRRGDVRAYGALLLEVGRRAGRRPLAAAAMSEPISFLERRIRIMTMPRERSPRLRAAGFGALTLALVAAACETPAPGPLAPVPVERVYSAADAPAGLGAAKLSMREAVARHFPEVLTRGTQGRGIAFFVVDHNGDVVKSSLREHGPGSLGRIEPVASRPGETGEGGAVGGRTQLRFGSMDELGVDPGQIETVDVMKFAAGKVGPDPLDVIWIRLRDPNAPATREGTRLRRSAASADHEHDVLVPVGEGDGSVAIGDEGTATRGERLPATDPAVIAQAVERYHPAAAQGEAAPEQLWFVVAADGTVVRTGTDMSSGLNEYPPDAIAGVEVFKGEAIRVNGRRVPVIWVRLKA